MYWANSRRITAVQRIYADYGEREREREEEEEEEPSTFELRNPSANHCAISLPT